MRAFVVVALFLNGCVRLADAPTLLSDDPTFDPPEIAAPTGISEDPAVEFRIAPGDILTLRTISATTSEYTNLLVDERGLLHAPLVGDIEVGGLSLTEAEARVETALQAFDRVVRVNVIVQASGGHRATVLGAVRNPGRMDVTPGMRLADLLAAAGGPLMAGITEHVEGADLAGAQLVRNGEAVPVSLELASAGDPLHNVRVRAGDHLYVPSARGATVTVLGEVSAPTIVGHRTGMRLTTALALAGGLAPDAHRSDIRVIRGSLAAPTVYRTSLRALVDGHGPDVQLAPGDIVYVTRTRLAALRDVLSAVQPLLFTAQNVGLAVGLTRSGR
jgi:polysaccharide export outer membrane protein